MNPTSYAFLGLTGIVAMLIAVLLFALLRFAAAARDHRRNVVDSKSESMFLTTALEDAIARMKAQERATAARAEASEWLNSEILASLASGLIVVNSEGTVQIINPAAQRILQLSSTIVLPSGTLLDRVPALRDVISESRRTREPILRRTIVLERADGPRHLGVTVSPLPGDRGRLGAICLFSDLTQVFALEEQLRLKETLARLGELTAGLAHEFRNGLATIHGYAWLFEDKSMPEQEMRYVKGIRDEAQALGEVVTNFLNFARPQPLILSKVDLRAVVERAVDDSPTAQVNITGRFDEVDADEVLLRQALSNLLRNAVDACAAIQIEPVIEVRGHLDSVRREVLITVTDNGPGIPPDSFSRLFQPFFTTRPGGTGLGLAIVQKIIVGHNGRITAANARDGGAVFSVTLPHHAEDARLHLEREPSEV